MADLFGQKATATFRYESPNGGVPAVVEVSGGGGSMAQNLILVDIQGSAEANVQIDKTFTDEYYVTSFGQRLTTWSLTGVCPRNKDCGGEGQIKEAGKALADFWSKTNAGDNGPIKVGITFDGLVFSGILVGMNVGPYRMQDVDAYRYLLTFIGSLQSTGSSGASTENGEATYSTGGGMGGWTSEGIRQIYA